MTRPDPVIFHIINTTADAGARFRLTDEAMTLARQAEHHGRALRIISAAWLDVRRLRRQLRAIGCIATRGTPA